MTFRRQFCNTLASFQQLCDTSVLFLCLWSPRRDFSAYAAFALYIMQSSSLRPCCAAFSVNENFLLFVAVEPFHGCVSLTGIMEVCEVQKLEPLIESHYQLAFLAAWGLKLCLFVKFEGCKECECSHCSVLKIFGLIPCVTSQLRHSFLK